MVLPPTLPASKLYRVVTAPNALYLMATDSQFIGSRTLVSSDFLLKKLKSGTSVNAITRAIEGKADRTSGVLVQADLSDSDMASIAARTWGKPSAQSIDTLFFRNRMELSCALIDQIQEAEMPKFACKCGNVLNLSGVWPECEWRLVPMARVGEIADRLDVGQVSSGDGIYDLVDEVSVTVYRCPVCCRLYLETGRNMFQTYAKEAESGCR